MAAVEAGQSFLYDPRRGAEREGVTDALKKRVGMLASTLAMPVVVRGAVNDDGIAVGVTWGWDSLQQDEGPTRRCWGRWVAAEAIAAKGRGLARCPAKETTKPEWVASMANMS